MDDRTAGTETTAGTGARDATTVYTDGACSGNPGPGGWAWAVPGGRWAAGPAAHTTNQRMEVQAVLDAAMTIDGPLDVVSDSTYVVNCFRDRWWEGWLRRGWTNSQKKPVANRDLWEPLLDAYRRDPGRIRFRWVKGHSGDVMNDLVDRLAVAAAATQQGRRGDTPPTALGPADRPTGARQGATPASPISPAAPQTTSPTEADVPTGHRIVVTGLRPPALGGYGHPPAAAALQDRLVEIIAAKAAVQPATVVLTGLGLGTEQLAAAAAVEAGVPFVAVLPFPGQDDPWPASSRERYVALLAQARSTTVLQAARPTSKQAAGGALGRRDAWLARHAEEAVVVWDGEDPTIGRSVRSLRDHLGEEQVWVVEPPG